MPASQPTTIHNFRIYMLDCVSCWVFAKIYLSPWSESKASHARNASHTNPGGMRRKITTTSRNIGQGWIEGESPRQRRDARRTRAKWMWGNNKERGWGHTHTAESTSFYLLISLLLTSFSATAALYLCTTSGSGMLAPGGLFAFPKRSTRCIVLAQNIFYTPNSLYA